MPHTHIWGLGVCRITNVENSSRGEYANTMSVQNLWELCTDSFLPYIVAQVQDMRRLNVVWDRYITDNLKQGLRERGVDKI